MNMYITLDFMLCSLSVLSSRYLSVGGPCASCRVWIVAGFHIGGYAAAWVVEALQAKCSIKL